MLYKTPTGSGDMACKVFRNESWLVEAAERELGSVSRDIRVLGHLFECG